jgi:hypothetical protein
MEDSSLKIYRVENAEEKAPCAELMATSEPWITLGISGEYLMNMLNDPRGVRGPDG